MSHKFLLDIICISVLGAVGIAIAASPTDTKLQAVSMDKLEIVAQQIFNGVDNVKNETTVDKKITKKVDSTVTEKVSYRTTETKIDTKVETKIDGETTIKPSVIQPR